MRSETEEPPERTAPEIADAPASMSFIGLNLRRMPPSSLDADGDDDDDELLLLFVFELLDIFFFVSSFFFFSLSLILSTFGGCENVIWKEHILFCSFEFVVVSFF